MFWGCFVEPELGFEPRTCCLQDSCSGQLSYSGTTWPSQASHHRIGFGKDATIFADYDLRHE